MHEHRFLASDEGTLATDEVQYGMPLGRLLHPLFIKRDLINIFKFRAQVMYDLFVRNPS